VWGARVGAAIWSFQPVTPGSTNTQRFDIPKGQAITVIGQRLQEAGLIKNVLAFRAMVKLEGLSNKIQAGSFELSPGMTLSEIGSALTVGADDVWVTIPEGWRTEEIAESLDKQELDAFNKEEFLTLADASEGMLFPETYLVPRDMDTEAIYGLLTRTFEQKVVEGLKADIAKSDHSLEEILTMASIIEREAATPEQMRHVSGILWNRIEIGMPLQADATLQYAKGYDKVKQSWWSPPLGDDRQLNSPYNSYTNPGLPPSPICNPGLEAIKAAINPDDVDDLFYVHDNQGNMHYSVTYDEHLANIQKYLR
jgi:UPF0755 protein